MGKPVGVFVLPGPEALRAEIQKLEEEIRRTAQEKKKRLMFLREMEGREKWINWINCWRQWMGEEPN